MVAIRVRCDVWIALATVVVAGILAMHALGTHGSTHGSMTAPVVLAAPASNMGADTLTADDSMAEAAAATLHDEITAPSSAEHGVLHSALLICVAVLVAGLALASWRTTSAVKSLCTSWRTGVRRRRIATPIERPPRLCELCVLRR